MSAGFNTANVSNLTRAELWSSSLKELLQDELMATQYVRWLTEFPDGDEFIIPSIGDMEVKDYVEDQAIEYSALDTGQFRFSITEYLSSATYITNKAKQDMYYMNELVSSFVPKQARALMQRLEGDILKEGQPRTGNPAGYQVAGNANLINSAPHRFVGGANINSSQGLSVGDFAKARYALKKANVPDTNLVAIVDPHVELLMNTQTQIVGLNNNPRWEGIVSSGIATGMRFIANIYGFDVYTSNYLPKSGANGNGASETIGGTASGTNAICNLFFSAAPDVTPFVGAWRQMPQVDTEYNKDFQREEYVTTARYGLKIFRPENLVTILSNPATVA
jgi:hypothetical protein